MNFNYDKKTDILVITFCETEIDDTEEIYQGVIADFDEAGKIVSLEILNASKKMKSLKEMIYNEKILD